MNWNHTHYRFFFYVKISSDYRQRISFTNDDVPRWTKENTNLIFFFVPKPVDLRYICEGWPPILRVPPTRLVSYPIDRNPTGDRRLIHKNHFMWHFRNTPGQEYHLNDNRLSMSDVVWARNGETSFLKSVPRLHPNSISLAGSV